MDITKNLIYDGISLADYGVGITGKGVYNAPERDVEMIEIPGRNGEYALDRGRFKNVPVTYGCGAFGNNQQKFAEKMTELRNQILSRRGYKRLEDEYHPDEYRMALYREGLEVDPVHYSSAGEFDLVFDCKPQRFLKSGETEQTLGNWGTTQTASGSIATFNGEADTGIKSLLVDIEAIQEGTGEPSLTNVRQISGRNTVNAYVSGKNLLWNMRGDTYASNGITFTKTADGKVIANGTATANVWYRLTEGFICKAPMVLSGCPSGGSASTYEIQLDGSNVRDFGNGASFNTSGNGRFYIVIRSGQTVNNLTFEPMVRLATESAGYEPYRGENVSKPLGQTVYGGTLDLISGELTITKKRAAFQFIGRTLTSHSGKYGFYSGVISDIKKPSSSSVLPDGMLCNRLAIGTRSESYNATKDCISIHPTEGRFYVYIDEISSMTLAEAQEWYSTHGIVVVYPLATPVTVQLTPSQVNTLVGTNNIWADSGEVEVEFGADPNRMVNPTLFESNPLLRVDGYGDININDDVISIQQGSVIGRVNIPYEWDKSSVLQNTTYSMGVLFNFSDVTEKSITGDAIYSPSTTVTIVLVPETPPPQYDYDFLPSQSGSTNNLLKYESYGFPDGLLYLKLKIDPIKFTVGTAETKTDVYSLAYTYEDGQIQGSSSLDFNLTATYTPNLSIRYVIEYTLPNVGEEDESRFLPTQDTVNRSRATVDGNVVLDSTKSAIGNLYIDLDIGEAYQIIDGSYVPINYAVTMPADLPTLKPGANDITFSNTITDLKIVPRWWRI